MKKIDHMVEDSLESRTKTYISDKDKKKLSRSILSAAAALTCLVGGYIFTKIYPDQVTVAELVYLIGVVIIGLPVLITAVKGFLSKDIGAAMEILVSVAIIVCVLDGQYVAAMLIPMILTVVHFFEEKSIMGGRDAIEGLKKMQAETAILLKNGAETEVDAKSLQPGDTILVKPGMALPIDGVVVRGEADMDQKSLTGESLPKFVRPGDKVYAGTTNTDGLLTVTVEKACADTSFQRIVKLLENAENMQLPEKSAVDKFMLYYIPIVLVIAVLIWFFSKDVSKAIAILVVSCPCGYMLVSSAPLIAALGAGAKRGVLIKNPAFIDKLTAADCFVFDKTGTITNGTLEAVGINLVQAGSEEELLAAAAAVAHGSTHPTSKSLMQLCGNVAYETDYVLTELPGKGMKGVKDGSEILMGNTRFIASLGFALPDPPEGGSASWVVKDGSVLGNVVFRDSLRADVDEAFAGLRALGVKKIMVLTGDSKIEAERIAADISADEMHAELLPEQKLDQVKAAKEQYTVATVGDGINDALALNAADVGVAMGAMGSDTAIQSADISLMNNNLTLLPFVMELAQKTKTAIRQNIWIAFITSFVMIFLAALGVVTPVMGAFLHNAGAFIVLFNSARVLRRKNEAKPEEAPAERTDAAANEAKEHTDETE